MFHFYMNLVYSVAIAVETPKHQVAFSLQAHVLKFMGGLSCLHFNIHVGVGWFQE